MPADVRFGQRWSLAQRAKNDAIYTLLRALDASLRHVPEPVLLATLRALATQVVLRSDVARANLKRVFYNESDVMHEARLRAHADALARHATVALRAIWGKAPLPPLPMDTTSARVLEEACAAGRGVVLASAHLGAWDRVAVTLAQRCPDFVAVVREPYDPRLARWTRALRRDFVCLPRGPSATRAMVRVLRRGGVLGMPMDLATRGAASCVVPFLDQPTAIVSGPARLALRCGAQVIVATYTQKRGHEGLRVWPVRTERSPKWGRPSSRFENGQDENMQTVHLTEQLAATLSEAIGLCPNEWLWLHPRWNNSV